MHDEGPFKTQDSGSGQLPVQSELGFPDVSVAKGLYLQKFPPGGGVLEPVPTPGPFAPTPSAPGGGFLPGGGGAPGAYDGLQSGRGIQRQDGPAPDTLAQTWPPGHASTHQTFCPSALRVF